MKHLILTTSILGLILVGCEDNDSNNSEATDTEIITHDIDATNAPGFYFNLSSGSEVDSSSTWHFSFQMISVSLGQSTYMMPSLILGATYAAEYSDITFDETDSSPSTFMSDYFQDSTVVQYGGANEVLQYDMQSHTVSVRNPERVFVFYESLNHKTYKLQFVEYVGGVIAFKYNSL
jgi:hypothetical protein|tara:strand:- start:238 stop:768 length:531 start_codon:yes stop_codon:yes gene_type:complete